MTAIGLNDRKETNRALDRKRNILAVAGLYDQAVPVDEAFAAIETRVIDLETGERAWKSGRYGYGQIILVDDLLLIQDDDGSVVLVEATPEEHRELTMFPALDGRTWNNPVLAGRLLLVRNDREAACFELPLAE